MDRQHTPRRPIAARESRWAPAIARRLTRAGLRPNQVSVLSLLFAGFAGLALVSGGRSSPPLQPVLFVLAAAFVELRLLCNLIDGMIAVEGGKGTKAGPVFNELPDRISDSIVLVAAGYAVLGLGWCAALGWSAALLAVLTAYVRALAGSLGATQDFGGPMAKQQRMQVLVLACVLRAAMARWPWNGWIFVAALSVIVAGSAATVIRRTAHLVRELEAG